jgi:hypothetical protein
MVAGIAGAMDRMTRRMFGPQPGAGMPGTPPAVPAGGVMPRPGAAMAAPPARPPRMAAPGFQPAPPAAPAMADDSVTSQFNRITAAGSPLIAMGRQAGLNIANRRGLLNSNMALGTALSEGYKAALPLAQQEAQTAAGKNLAAIDNRAQMQRLAFSTASTERMQGSDIAAQKDRLRIANDAQMAQLERQLAGASDQQRVEIQGQMDRLRETNVAEMARLERSGQLDTAGREQQGLIQGRLQQDQNQAEMARLRTSLTGASEQQRADILAQMERLRAANDAEAARIAQQGQVQTGLNSQQNIAEMARLQASLAGASEQQRTDIVAQMERLRAANQAESERIAQQGQVQGGLNAQQSAAEMARLQASIAGASDQQKADIQAQMERLNVAAAQDRARIEVQGRIDLALQTSGAEQQRVLAGLQGDIASKLQTQQDAGRMQQLNAQFAHDIEVQKGDNDARLRQIAATGDQEVRRVVEAGLQERDTLAMNIAAGDRREIASSMISIFAAETQLRAALLGNTNMPASERAAYERAIAGMGDPIRNYISQLYAPPAPAGAGASGPLPPLAPPPAGGDAGIGTGGSGLIQNPDLGYYYDGGQGAFLPLPQVVPAPPSFGRTILAPYDTAPAGLVDPALAQRLRQLGQLQ